MEMTGNEEPYGFPVSGLIVAGPVVPTCGFFTFRLASVSALTTKYLSVSMALPGPMIASQYPAAFSSGLYRPAACEVPEKKCATKMALSPAALSLP